LRILNKIAMNSEDAKNIKNIRIDILDMIYKAKEGHIASSFSVVELLYAIYSGMGKNDSFFLSKGHASAALFAVLAHFGHIDRKELDGYCKYDSRLGGHPHRFSDMIMSSTGSLGHGFPMAAGYALAKKIKNEPGRVFCIIGDGETNEGSVWETAMYAEQLGLSNLICIIDDNNSQVRAKTSINLKEKFAAFGWRVVGINGHDVAEIRNALFSPDSSSSSVPYCVVAKTTKGKGVKQIESDMFSWHHKAPTEAELAEFKKEILSS
jgi:transketolase